MKYKTIKICNLRHFIPKHYVLNVTFLSDNNKRFLAPNDYNKHNFLLSVLMSWLGLWETDNIKRMKTLTLSGFYCTGRNLPDHHQSEFTESIVLPFIIAITNPQGLPITVVYSFLHSNHSYVVQFQPDYH